MIFPLRLLDTYMTRETYYFFHLFYAKKISKFQYLPIKYHDIFQKTKLHRPLLNFNCHFKFQRQTLHTGQNRLYTDLEVVAVRMV